MTQREFKKLKIGDEVIVQKSIKDAYGEVWHEVGDIGTIKSFTSDGVGVMFEWSDLGTHFKNIEFKARQNDFKAIIRGIKKLTF